MRQVITYAASASTRARLALGALFVVLSASPILAQPRNGNIYDGIAHQPTRAAVAEQERAAGVALPSSERNQNAKAVDDLDKQLLHDEAVDPPTNSDRSAMSQSSTPGPR